MRQCTLFSLLCVAGCASAPTGTPISTPVRPNVISVASTNVDSMMYFGVELRVAGSSIGGHYDGLLKVYQWAVQPNADTERTWVAWMQKIGLDMLRSAGYKVKETSQIFGRAQSTGSVRYALAGTVTGLEFNTYGKLAGNKSTANVRIAFELFDSKQRDVVYKTERSASATTSGTSGASFELAFQNIIGSLLSDRSFVAALTRPLMASTSAAAAAVQWQRSLPNESDIVTVSAAELNPISTGSIFERNSPAVVSVSGSGGGGTAFILTRDGLALTNHHVIESQSDLQARFVDGRRTPLRVIRSNKDADIALIQINCPTSCTTVVLGDEARVEVGADVYVIGTPVAEALTHTLTKGVISGRRLSSGLTLLQTDAAVNPGNSGGPIMNSDGVVVALTSSKLVGTGLEGLGFGISITDALRVIGLRIAR